MDPFTLFIINLIIGVVFSVASTLLAQTKQHDQRQPVHGVRGTIQTGGDIPQSFIMGFYGTAGSLAYIGTWGASGETPNAYLTKVVALSDLPVRGLAGFFVNGVRCTLGDTASGDLGLPVTEYPGRMWVKFYDGTQTTADPLLLAQFGSDPDRPWLNDMIGRGVAYAVVTALYEREIFNGIPDYFFEIDGIELDDPRGDDGHMNPIVGIRTILKGLSYGGDWFYGPQGISDARLPSTNWEAQMDKCDVGRELEGGGTEPRFRFGLEVAVDQEPHAVIGELLKACEGRIAEIGGIYKVLVGEPEAPVVSFTDQDIVISAGQSYDPFPGLESTYNAITATYPEPDEAWETKEAPPRYRSDLEALDDGRRLPFSTEYKAVPFPVQVQELTYAAIEETRRFRKHSHTAPPEWWEYEPLDAAEWTSARNGYEAKQFLITVMDDLPNANQVVGLQEIDPGDYSWSSELELPYDVVVPVANRPPPQPIVGFAIEPYSGVDMEGNPRRPGFRIYGYAAGLVDVESVWVQARLSGATGLVLDGRAPYDPADPTPAAAWAGDPLLRDTTYEVRGKLVPFSGRETEWSSWLEVTTPDVGIDENDLGASFLAMQQHFGLSIRDLNEQMMLATSLSADQDAANYADRLFLEEEIRIGDDDIYASSVEALLLALGADGSSLADAVTAIEAASGDVTAGFLSRITATAGPGDNWVRYGQQIRAGFGENLVTVSDFWEVNALTGLSRRVMKASETFIVDDADNVLALFDAGGASFDNARIVDLTADNIAVKSLDADEVLIDGTIITDVIAANAISNIVASTLSADLNITGAASDTSWKDVLSVTITPNGGDVLVDASTVCFARLAQFNTYNASDLMYVRLLKNGTEVVIQPNYYEYIAFGTAPDYVRYDFASNTLSFRDASPGTSSITYKLQVRAWGASGFPGWYLTAAAGSSLRATNLKK